MPFNQQMSFPAELRLITTPDGPRLTKRPVKEIEGLQGRRREWASATLKPGENLLADLKGDCFRIQCEIEPGDARAFGFRVRGQTVAYRVAERKLEAVGTAPLDLQDGRIRLDILVDRTTIETFANDGTVTLSSVYHADPQDLRLESFAEGGSAKVISLSVTSLNSIWPAKGERGGGD